MVNIDFILDFMGAIEGLIEKLNKELSTRRKSWKSEKMFVDSVYTIFQMFVLISEKILMSVVGTVSGES